MAVEKVPHQERVEFLEAGLDYLRELLAVTDPTRGIDSRRRYQKTIAAINHTRAELVLARYEAELDD